MEKIISKIHTSQNEGIRVFSDILTRSGDINAVNNTGDPIILVASYFDEGELFQMLLEYPNIDINKTGEHGYTALFWAIIRKKFTILWLLLDKKELNLSDYFLMTKAFSSIVHNLKNTNFTQEQFIKKLIFHPHFDINIRCNNKKDGEKGDTLLMNACAGFEYSLVITTLLSHPNINLNLKNKRGENAYNIARRERKHEAERLIMSDSRYISNKRGNITNTSCEKKCISIFPKKPMKKEISHGILGNILSKIGGFFGSQNIPKEIYSSKLGGIPYWPYTKDEYPKNKNNQLLFHLASINFAEISHIKELGEEWPTQGILQFFIDANDELYGLDTENPMEQIGFKVIYHKSIDEGKKLFIPRYSKDTLDSSPLKYPNEGIKLSFELNDSRTVSGTCDYYELIEQGFIPEDFEEYDIENQHQIGGYPHFTQTDPRSSCEHMLLFQLAYDDYVMFGDGGIANFFIKKEDLKVCDFSKVWYNWDCS